MATNIPQTIELSTPQVVVNGYVWPIVPNSLKVRIPGDFKVRAISAGGAAVQVVSGLDATNLLGKIDFDVPATKDNADRVRALKNDMFNGLGCTVQINDNVTGYSAAYQSMFFSKDTEIMHKASGDIKLEMEGSAVL